MAMKKTFTQTLLRRSGFLLILVGTGGAAAPNPPSLPTAPPSPPAAAAPAQPRKVDPLDECKRLGDSLVNTAKSLKKSGVASQPDCRPFQVDAIRDCSQKFEEARGPQAALDFLNPIYAENPCPLFRCSLARHNILLLDKTLPANRAVLELQTVYDGESCLHNPDASKAMKEYLEPSLPRKDIKDRALRWKWAGITMTGIVAPLLLGASFAMVGFTGYPTGATDCSFGGMQQPCVYDFRVGYAVGFALSGAMLGFGGFSLYKWRRTWKEYMPPLKETR
jgi:hypothetical protein